MIIIAVAILIAIGFIHSYLGERYILIRLFKRDNIPHLFGGDEFTKGTLRFCWHTISLAAFGFAAILYDLQSDPQELKNLSKEKEDLVLKLELLYHKKKKDFPIPHPNYCPPWTI